jgi:hypothetical protein
MRRDQRFPVLMSQTERKALQHLADHERIPAAAVVRRLVYREARERGLWPPPVASDSGQAQTQEQISGGGR